VSNDLIAQYVLNVALTNNFDDPNQFNLLDSGDINLAITKSSLDTSVLQVVQTKDGGNAPNMIFQVNSPCCFNIGAMGQQNSNTVRMCFYIFNYSDFFEAESSLQNYTYVNSGCLTYMRATPYFIDELYDNSPFSSLGRSIKIDSTLVSSLNKPINFNTPVIIIFAYASTSNTSLGAVGLAASPITLTNTYSNFIDDTFCGVYLNAPTYNFAITDINAGPLSSFYGLSNATANDTIAKNTVNDTSVKRKDIVDFDLNENPCLGLDIRQVFPTNVLTVSTQESVSSYSIDGSTVGTFTTVNLQNPNWANAVTTTQPFLPLAGTFLQDLNTGTVFSSPQLVPNYDGLSLMAEWRKNTPSQSQPYQMYAVDRSTIQVPSDLENQNPFALTNLDLMRPTTKFVSLCDVWRNTLRAAVQVPASWSQANAFANSGIQVNFMDCMGPEMYDITNTTNNDYFGMCNGTLLSNNQFYSLSQPSTVRSPSYTLPNLTGGNPGSTPWTVNGRVWSPFTGGSYWNTFSDTNGSQLSSDPIHFSFSPQLWYPTYNWVLGKQDINNVWPTSIASNAALLLVNQAVFSSTDGSIRKTTLGELGPSFVSEITGPQTFFNYAINKTGINFVESYVNPGRIYNLTYWQDNWWFTADTASVWTTAPTFSGLQLSDPKFIESFTASEIKFRPLSVEEGSPQTWSNTSWPSNVAHRFNVMRVIQYAGSEALFVSSIDGEYMILTRSGTSFTAVIQNENTAKLYVPSGATGPSAESLYISDIAISGQSIVIGSLPLALDPQQFPVPWSNDNVQSPIPILSLGSTPPNAQGPVLLINSQDWTLPLQDANVVKSTFMLPTYDGSDVKDFSSSYSTFMNPINTANGLRRLQLPTENTKTDALLPFYPKNFRNDDISVGSNLIVDPDNESDIPIITFSMDYQNYLVPDSGVPTFYKAGFDMDIITKAFFTIDGPGKIPTNSSLGLQTFGLVFNRPNVNIQSTISPMFTNSISFAIKISSETNVQLTSEFIHPTQGPLSEYINELNDYASLNIFQNMTVMRTSPVQSNQIISNISYAEELNAIAWTTFGPFSAYGVTIASLADGKTSIVPADTSFNDAHFLQQSPILEWNPYELRWYAAGLCNNMYDFASLVYPDPNLRPAGISEEDYKNLQWDPKDQPLNNHNSRLMLLYADASEGLSDSKGAIKFQQVYRVLSQSLGTYVVRPVSRDFDSITCFSFSPNAVVIGGSLKQSARICFKLHVSVASNDLKDSWSFTDLNVPGYVTAIKYVGYAFYITTWDAVALRSSLFFASLTFAGITSIDSWNTNSTAEVTTISAVLPPSTKCADGYEPDPFNPAICIKKCPTNFDPFGTLCVQRCPAPYSTTGVANECQPDSMVPNVTVATARGENPPLSQVPKSGPCVGPSCDNANSIHWPLFIAITVLVLLGLAFVFGILYAIRNK
jgi:hypothetical protein